MLGSFGAHVLRGKLGKPPFRPREAILNPSALCGSSGAFTARDRLRTREEGQLPEGRDPPGMLTQCHNCPISWIGCGSMCLLLRVPLKLFRHAARSMDHRTRSAMNCAKGAMFMSMLARSSARTTVQG
jgi:hypothetical protein